MSQIEKHDLVFNTTDTASFFRANDSTLLPSSIDNEIPMIVIEKIESERDDTCFFFCLYKNSILIVKDNFLVHVK